MADVSHRTGTLTKNQLTMGEPYTVGICTRDNLVLVACLAASRKIKGMDPIDKAFVRALSQYPEARGPSSSARLSISLLLIRYRRRQRLFATYQKVAGQFA